MKGSFFQSRRQSNFYNSMKPDNQVAYAKQWVASCNSKLLEPFVKITGAAKFNREVLYEIDIDRLLKVEEENKRLREALEFYANKDSYKVWREGLDPELEHIHDVDFDGGHKARKALEGEQHGPSTD